MRSIKLELDGVDVTTGAIVEVDADVLVGVDVLVDVLVMRVDDNDIDL